MKAKKINGLKIFLIFLLIVGMSCAACGLSGCDGQKEVKSITISKEPTKTEYNVGEEFSPAGGEITITYADGTTETKAMTDEGVTIDTVNTTVEEGEDSSERTVTVRYGKKGARFKITVTYRLFDFVFDYGDAEQESVAVKTKKDTAAARPADPTRANYTFDNWYADAALTMIYDFKQTVTADTTVYAKWLDNNATYVDVTFDYNFIGAVNPAPQKVKQGGKAVKLSVDPVRKGYSFDGWVTSADGGASFDFDVALTTATKIYAKWSRTAAGKETYVFEAEDGNLDGKTGNGLSGTASATAMIQQTTEHGASNDRFVGYLYELGLSLEFQIVSDVEIEDATVVFRFSAEMRDFDIDPSSFTIAVNYNYLEYDKISFTNVPKGNSDDVSSGVKALPFQDYTIATGVKLVKGRNFIQLQVNNDEKTEGTTMTAIAPLVDCLKITTEAVLTWDASLGLPKKNY